MSKPSDTVSRAGALPLVGGALALDFCNTASGRRTKGALDHLRTGSDVVVWSRHAGVLGDADGIGLHRRCADDPAFAQRLLDRALALREAVYRLDAALAAHEPPDQADIDALATSYVACLAAGRLTTCGGGFGWTWTTDETPAESLLGPIVASAMMVLMSADHTRLKQCPGHHCGWLFLDTTKNNKRRWCEMEVCGNRAKQKRHRGRSDQEPSGPSSDRGGVPQ